MDQNTTPANEHTPHKDTPTCLYCINRLKVSVSNKWTANAMGGARDGRGVGVWALGMLAITTAVSGTNEVARLWIFLVPLFAVAAAMARRWAAEEAAALVVAQLAVAVALGAAGPW